MAWFTRNDFSPDMARIYEELCLQDHQARHDGGISNPAFSLEEADAKQSKLSLPGLLQRKSSDVSMASPGLLVLPGLHNRKMSSASMISGVSRISRREPKDDKTVLRSVLRQTSALGRVELGVGR